MRGATNAVPAAAGGKVGLEIIAQGNPYPSRTIDLASPAVFALLYTPSLDCVTVMRGQSTTVDSWMNWALSSDGMQITSGVTATGYSFMALG